MEGFRGFRFWPNGWRELDFEPERAELFLDVSRSADLQSNVPGLLRDVVAINDAEDLVLCELTDGGVAEAGDPWAEGLVIYDTIWTWIDAVNARAATAGDLK